MSGEDAASFLQGQFTNELRGLPSRAAVYGLWLTVKGKVLADSFVLRGVAPNEFWIGSYFSDAAIIRARLESFIIADDVTLEDATHEWAAVSVLGADVPQLLADHADDATFVFRGRREPHGNLECVYRTARGAPDWIAASSLPPLAPDDVARRRIAAGIPAVGIDVGAGDLPNEAGLESAAISYTKGCYLGQEVMARLKAMGQVRRRLLRVRGAGPAPNTPAPVFTNSRQVGELRSAVSDAEGTGWLGLAMVSLLHVTAGAKLALALDTEPVVSLADLP